MLRYTFHNNKETKHILLIYDIHNDIRRRKLAKLLESYGERIQESAFEFHITAAQYGQLSQKINTIMNESEDNIRIYMLHPDQVIIQKGISIQTLSDCDLLIC